MNQINEAIDVRVRLRRILPASAFERKPSRAWLIPISNLVIGLCAFLTLHFDLAWYWMLAIALILAHQYFAMGIVSHDIMHGAVLKDRRLRVLVSYFGFYPFFISPRTWNMWHNKAHHGHTNTDRDPDANLTSKEYSDNAIARFGIHLLPSPHNRWLGVAFFTYWLTLVGQVILWFGGHFKTWALGEDKVELFRARLETVTYFAFWIALGYYAGPYKSLFIILIPMLLGNAAFMAFASSQHVYLPMTDVNDPLSNCASVRVPRWVDILTLNFSHHVEHHLFPSMSYMHLPKVRAWLRENKKGTYMEPTFADTFRLVFNTSRVYQSKTNLYEPGKDTLPAVDTALIRDALRRGETVRTAGFVTRYSANQPGQ